MEETAYQDITLKLAPLLDALSHPARLQILLYLAKNRNCPANNISNKLPLCKSTVSQHMAKLKESGLITYTTVGVCQNYRLNDESFLILKKYFLDFSKKLERLNKEQTDCKI